MSPGPGPHPLDPDENAPEEGEVGEDEEGDFDYSQLDPLDFGLAPRARPLTRGDFEPPPPPSLDADAHKGEAGRLLCLCGSADMPGAASLVAKSALRMGAGLVTVGYLDVALRDAVAAQCVEATFLDLTDLEAPGDLAQILSGRADHAVVLGPGLGQSPAAVSLVRDYFACEARPTVLDADGLNIISEHLDWLADYGAPLIITPHAGEARRLLGRPVANDPTERSASARELAASVGAICCLKGAWTVISDSANTNVNLTGNPGLATAGSGDVLSGVIGALLAASVVRGGAFFPPFEAARCGVFIHGIAGDMASHELGELGVIASDLLDALPIATSLVEGRYEQDDQDDGGSAQA
ncbi:MAG: NAD(P)H-hydrate dehydratase [Planctomycetota bacterium]|jgi:NAD(P)H-hydrate epimerase|nr:NAD(P)H-hydrate dehydratase [Planctomycetota bacterium]MDP6956694.1 NAD(P)H-hydrate dehydratase [Planctomycetota bacterium]